MLHTAAPTATTTVTETLVGQKVLESGRKEKGINYKLSEGREEMCV
jgi:hypothetical protein